MLLPAAPAALPVLQTNVHAILPWVHNGLARHHIICDYLHLSTVWGKLQGFTPEVYSTDDGKEDGELMVNIMVNIMLVCR